MRRFEREYEAVFPINKPNAPVVQQYVLFEHRVIGNNIFWKDRIKELKEGSFNSFDLIVNNSNYTAEYLKRIYVIEYYKILISVQKKVEKQMELSKK